MDEPFAVELYRLFLSGESAQQLSATFGISLERIEQRLRAAAAYIDRRGWGADGAGPALTGWAHHSPLDRR